MLTARPSALSLPTAGGFPRAWQLPRVRGLPRARSLMASLAVALFAGLMGAAPAAAHTQLEKVSPADEATVTVPPSRVVLTFSETVSSTFAVVQVKGPGGESVSEGRARVDGAVVTEMLAASLAPGKYTVAYRVVSSDGHAVSDATTFTIAASTPSSTSESATPPTSAATTLPAASEAATMGPPTDVFDSSHIPGFLVVGLLVLGALLLLLSERRRRRH